MEPLSPLPLALPHPGSRLLLASLHTQLRAAILDGRLKPGLRLPSTRALARLYRVSRNTAVAAYDMLLSEGYISARRGSGTVVTDLLPRPHRRQKPDVGSRFQRRLHPYWRRQAVQMTGPGSIAPRLSFQLGVPDAQSFPYETWRALSARVLRRFRADRTHTGDPQGLAACRQAIAAHVSFTRAVACGPEDVVVTAGAQQAFDLLAQILTIHGRSTVAIEDPGYLRLRAAFQSKGSRIRPVPVDAEGIRVEHIPAAAGVICVTPSHQFPLGVVMSSRRRAELLEHCRRCDAVVIEDDYDGEFRFEDRPLDALQTLDSAQCVFYVGTFSKTLLPDLRLGYIVAPPWALKALVAAKRVADGECSSMLQATVALLISEGYLARHVRRMQRIYGRRREVLLDGLHSGFGRWLEPLPSIAGLHLACRLQIDCDERSLVTAALGQGVLVNPLQPHFTGPASMRGLLLGYGAIDERSIAEGLVRLRRAMPR